MRNTSTAYKTQIQGTRQFCVKAVITYSDGSTETLTDLEDFMRVKCEDSCSGSSEFEIGAAIINEAVIVLNNRLGKFSSRSWFGARIVLSCGILVNGAPEYLKMGTYVVNEPVSPGITISLTAYDNMIFTEKDYVPSITFPATRAQVARDACDQCNIELKSTNFPGASETVREAPEGATCREVLSAIAQLGCCFVRCDNDGLVEIRWYSSSTHSISVLSSRSICTDDVVITGVTVENGDTTAESGADGYRIHVKDNLLLEAGNEQTYADYLAQRLVGMTFRPMTLKCKSDPSMEAGDRMTVTDETGTTYSSLITTTIFSVHESQTVNCDAAAPTVNSAKRNTQAAQALIKAKKYAEEYTDTRLSEYDQNAELLKTLLVSAMGYHKTEVEQQDGSVIVYMHDKEDLDDSTVIWKQTIDAFAVSTDGGETWKGMDKSGNAVLNVLSVNGLNASWIDTGTLTARDQSGNIVFLVNVDTGEVRINASSITMGTSGTTVEQSVNSATAAAADAESRVQSLENRAASGEFKGEDATLIYIESSRGNVFKNNDVATTLSVVLFKGGQRITDITTLRSVYGATAYLEWKWRRITDTDYQTISVDDSRLSNDGFSFYLSPEDVDTKVTFICNLITD